MNEQVQLPEHLKNMTILYVEDMTFYQSLVQQTLEQMGHVGKTHFAASVKEAIGVTNAIYKSGGKLDFIICDYHLQDSVGLDLLTKVRSNPVLENLPFIIFSTDDNKKNILAVFSAGADEYMFKPIDAQTLLNKITFCWDKRRSETARG